MQSGPGGMDCQGGPKRRGQLQGMVGTESSDGIDLIGVAAMEAAQLVAEGWSMRDATSEMAEAYGVSRREVYSRAHDAYDELEKSKRHLKCLLAG